MSTPSPARLSELAAAAVALASKYSYSVYAEVAGELLLIGPAGRPGRDLVICLGPPAQEEDAPLPAPPLADTL
jgi:hypothetical protein